MSTKKGFLESLSENKFFKSVTFTTAFTALSAKALGHESETQPLNETTEYIQNHVSSIDYSSFPEVTDEVKESLAKGEISGLFQHPTKENALVSFAYDKEDIDATLKILEPYSNEDISHDERLAYLDNRFEIMSNNSAFALRELGHTVDVDYIFLHNIFEQNSFESMIKNRTDIQLNEGDAERYQHMMHLALIEHELTHINAYQDAMSVSDMTDDVYLSYAEGQAETMYYMTLLNHSNSPDDFLKIADYVTSDKVDDNYYLPLEVAVLMRVSESHFEEMKEMDIEQQHEFAKRLSSFANEYNYVPMFEKHLDKSLVDESLTKEDIIQADVNKHLGYSRAMVLSRVAGVTRNYTSENGELDVEGIQKFSSMLSTMIKESDEIEFLEQGSNLSNVVYMDIMQEALDDPEGFVHKISSDESKAGLVERIYNKNEPNIVDYKNSGRILESHFKSLTFDDFKEAAPEIIKELDLEKIIHPERTMKLDEDVTHDTADLSFSYSLNDLETSELEFEQRRIERMKEHGLDVDDAYLASIHYKLSVSLEGEQVELEVDDMEIT